MNEITNGLQALVARDFQFAHPRDADGGLVAVVGIRVHRGVFDIVQLFSEHEADAARIPGDEPDVLFPSKVLWRTTGPAHEVIAELLALSEPAPDLGAQPTGCWLPTHAGRSTWLAATA
ncbi:hypothetical protein SAMN05216215_10882 [Saccharopolyspora shandongensis]|uniref:Uncharacterized protein n=1 Tax=Saccharopolyspora shandongensis TaxID=418495 RepID=A0A1H3TNZ1_9PSEU|nr:hypothetical protein [Saccharopolyspora shandongensis]SDZ51737.1 hypothetical protein SAMN05216215_10882 [Saccharopolyspora shandongensis]